MRKIYKKRFLIKLIVLIYFLLNPITSFAKVGDQKWSKICSINKICQIVIVSQIAKPDSDKKQTIATAMIQIALTKTKESVPILFIKLPLNVNLKKKPLLMIDKKKILNLPFSHCNKIDGCSLDAIITPEILKLLKGGNELTVISGIYNSKNNLQVKFPLKGFSKSYKDLLK